MSVNTLLLYDDIIREFWEQHLIKYDEHIRLEALKYHVELFLQTDNLNRLSNGGRTPS
ncbi:MAG: hypothetical protein ACI4ES_09970 [Roseburia sp.]